MEPPPDTSWLHVESVRAKPDPFGDWATGYRPQPPETAHGPGWVHRTETAPAAHECAPPDGEGISNRTHGVGTPPYRLPAGDEGDLWRCWCGRLWCHAPGRWTGVNLNSWVDAHWARASLRQRLRWWGTPGRPEPRPKPPHPPAGESGISRSPDGTR